MKPLSGLLVSRSLAVPRTTATLNAPQAFTPGSGASGGYSSAPAGGGSGVDAPVMLPDLGPGNEWATKPAFRSLKPIGAAVTMKLLPGHLYAIGIAVPWPTSILPTSALAAMGVDQVAGFDLSLKCARCGLFTVAQSPYARATGNAEATHVAFVQYTGAQEREVNLSERDPSGTIRWIDDVTAQYSPTEAWGTPPGGDDALPWIIGGGVLVGLVGLVYFTRVR